MPATTYHDSPLHDSPKLPRPAPPGPYVPCQTSSASPNHTHQTSPERSIPRLPNRTNPQHAPPDLPRPASPNLFLHLLQPIDDAKQLHGPLGNRLFAGLPSAPSARGNLDLPRRLRERQAERLPKFLQFFSVHFSLPAQTNRDQANKTYPHRCCHGLPRPYGPSLAPSALPYRPFAPSPGTPGPTCPKPRVSPSG